MSEKKAGIGGRAKGGTKTRMNALSFAIAMRELQDGPSTRAELTEATGLHWHTINLLVKALHQQRVIHISGWERDSGGRMSLAVFQLGQKKDVPKPLPMTQAERMRAHREREVRRVAVMATAGASSGASA